MYKSQQIIYLAGGCFWGVEAYMSRLKGVNMTEVGYANGKTHDPTYESVCTWKSSSILSTRTASTGRGLMLERSTGLEYTGTSLHSEAPS